MPDPASTVLVSSTRVEIAVAIWAALWQCKRQPDFYLDGPAFRREIERSMDLLFTWLAAARPQA